MKDKSRSSVWHAWIMSRYTELPRLDPNKKWWQFWKPDWLYQNPTTNEYKSLKQLKEEALKHLEEPNERQK